MALRRLPAIKYGGATFTGSIAFGYAIDNGVATSRPRDGSEQVQAVSGVEDAWTVGTDHYLSFDWRWIPTNLTASPSASGWDDAVGVRTFLEAARDKQLFRWIPDATVPATYVVSYLVEPMDDSGVSLEADGTRRVRVVIRNSGSAYTGY